jgi:hypothetical protein
MDILINNFYGLGRSFLIKLQWRRTLLLLINDEQNAWYLTLVFKK